MHTVPGLQITVGHRTMSNQIWQMSEQNQILIGHNVRPNKIYCHLSDEKFLLNYVKRETPLFDKESRPISFRNSINWMNFNSCLTESVF